VTEDPRERRAAAYAKLLEAQRIYFALRRTPADAGGGRLSAQLRKTLDQALELDPTLAEALTLKAELAFYFPPTNWVETESLASRSVAVNPDNLGAHRVLARLYTLQCGIGRKAVDQPIAAKAINELREVTRLNSSDAEAWALLSEFYDQAGRTDDAVAAMQRWAASPEAADKWFFKAAIPKGELSADAALARWGATLIKSGKASAAIDPIMRAISLDSRSDEYTDLLQTALEESGADTNEIVIQLQRLVATNPDGTGLVKILAATQARAGQVNEAAALLRASLVRVDKEEDNQDSWLIRFALADIYLDADDGAAAIGVYQEMLQRAGIGEAPIASDSDREIAADLLPRIVTVQKNAGQFAEAAQTIERIRRLFGTEDSTADEQMITLLRDQRKFREALVAVRTARTKFPNDAGLPRTEAALLTDSGKVNEAVALLRAKIPAAPATEANRPPSSDEFILLLTISSLYSQAGQPNNAITVAKDALSRAPANSPGFATAALLTLASAQERARDYKGAEESLRKILERDPDNATALNNLGYFLAERGERLPEALAMVKRAVRAQPRNSSFLDSLGWVYFKLGKYEEAERHLTNALRRDPTSFTMNDHLGDVYHLQNKPEQARAAWQRALSASIVTDDVAPLKAKLSGKTKQ
jgi:tetratricopeptide (TPR) repeat protein